MTSPSPPWRDAAERRYTLAWSIGTFVVIWVPLAVFGGQEVTRLDDAVIGAVSVVVTVVALGARRAVLRRARRRSRRQPRRDGER